MSERAKVKKAKPAGSKTSKPGPKKCPIGETKRVSYNKKAYNRVDKDGQKVHVKATHVGSTCVPSKGKALVRGRKTRTAEKVLPKFDGKFHLRDYGYATSKGDSFRHSALNKASDEIGTLKVMRHLNLARNINADQRSKMIMEADVKFLSIKHAKNQEAEGLPSHSVYLKAKTKKAKPSGSKTTKAKTTKAKTTKAKTTKAKTTKAKTTKAKTTKAKKAKPSGSKTTKAKKAKSSGSKTTKPKK